MMEGTAIILLLAYALLFSNAQQASPTADEASTTMMPQLFTPDGSFRGWEEITATVVNALFTTTGSEDYHTTGIEDEYDMETKIVAGNVDEQPNGNNSVLQLSGWWNPGPEFDIMENCKDTRTGEMYNGTKSTTARGDPCAPWSELNRFVDADFPADGSVEAAGHFCRNPVAERKEGGPWCYLDQNPGVKADCKVPLCINVTEEMAEARQYLSNFKSNHAIQEAPGAAAMGVTFFIMLGMFIIAFVVADIRALSNDVKRLTRRLKRCANGRETKKEAIPEIKVQNATTLAPTLPCTTTASLKPIQIQGTIRCADMMSRDFDELKPKVNRNFKEITESTQSQVTSTQKRLIHRDLPKSLDEPHEPTKYQDETDKMQDRTSILQQQATTKSIKTVKHKPTKSRSKAKISSANQHPDLVRKSGRTFEVTPQLKENTGTGLEPQESSGAPVKKRKQKSKKEKKRQSFQIHRGGSL